MYGSAYASVTKKRKREDEKPVAGSLGPDRKHKEKKVLLVGEGASAREDSRESGPSASEDRTANRDRRASVSRGPGTPPRETEALRQTASGNVCMY